MHFRVFVSTGGDRNTIHIYELVSLSIVHYKLNSNSRNAISVHKLLLHEATSLFPTVPFEGTI